MVNGNDNILLTMIEFLEDICQMAPLVRTVKSKTADHVIPFV